MKSYLLLAFALLISIAAYAEGGSCPSGYYPVGGDGWSGCAPLPGSNSGDPRPISGPSWKTQWIAIAMGGGGFGVGRDQPSRRKAEKVAMEQCKQTATTGKCKIDIVTFNQCVAVSGGRKMAISFRSPTQQEAESGSNSACEAMPGNSGESCKVFFAACSYPYRAN